ncbi:50S ribosomal protein L11 methyltransferase [Methanosphaera sp.]
MTYYDDLTKDIQRVNLFKKAITQKTKGIVYDLGTGSGILAEFASELAKKVYAVEQNPFIIKKTSANFSKYNNIQLIHEDATKHIFLEKPDVIICEMMDTALIDEEQVPVINNSLKYVDDSTIFIPQAAYTTIQLISTNIQHITYYEDNLPEYDELSDEVKYNEVIFSERINDKVNENILLSAKNNGIVNAIKLTTYTIITDELITGPTPMLNPPLLIPVDKLSVEKDDKIVIDLKYIMGGGLNTIQTNIRKDK